MVGRCFCFGALICAVAAAAPPGLRLDLPLDGRADASYAADGYGKTSYTVIEYGPGHRGQAARVGSVRYPCGLVAHVQRCLDPSRGSLSLWYRADWDPGDERQRRGVRTLVATPRGRGEPEPLALGIWGATLSLRVGVPRALNASVSVGAWKAGQWHHIVATWEREKGIALFVDGQQAGAKEGTCELPRVGRLYFGAEVNGTQFANGWLDDIRLYDRPLTAAEAQAEYGGELPRKKAEALPIAAPRAAAERAKAKLVFDLPFDGSVEARQAAGNPAPVKAEGVKYGGGVVGQALLAQEGLQLEYEAEKNLSKEAGAVSLWVCPLAEGLKSNCAYFADDKNTWLNPGEVANALWLWMWASGPTLRFDVRPPLLQSSAKQWRPGTWHHVVGCWQQGELSLYADGKLVARKKGQAARWPTEPAKLMFVGNWNGRYPAQALIDEVKVYDAPLTARQVEAEATERVLPLTVDLRPTLFEQGQGATLAVRVYNSSGRSAQDDVMVAIRSPEGKQVLSKTLRLPLPARKWSEESLDVRGSMVLEEGVYEVMCRPKKYAASTMSTYFLVVPRMRKQKPTDGVARVEPKLKLLADIDCSQELPAEQFASTGSCQVVESALGKYREAGPARYDRMAYRFRIERPGVAHVIVVTYPDDKARACDIVGNSPHFASGTYDIGTGYYCGDENPLSHRMIEFPIWFTPREEDNAIVFMTLEQGRPAACARIRVYEAEGGLPTAAVRPAPDGGRRIGLYWEDPTICLEHGGLDFSPPEVYKSFERLVDYLRFSGQNLICYPIAWYIGTMYPSALQEFRGGSGANRHSTDWVEYALRLCGARGVRFLPEMYFAGTYQIRERWHDQSEEEIAEGEPTAKMVMWDGACSPGFYFEPPEYNVLYPEVREALIAYVEEAVDRYRDFPALEGISLLVGEGNCVWFGSLQCGYDDYTVGLFEKETGITVPADKTGPARFSQRFRWLNEQCYEQWVQWRCEKIRDLHLEISRRVQRRRKDLKLYLTFYAIDGHMRNPLFKLNTWRPDGRSTEQIYREGGFDMRLYRDLPGVVLRRVMYPIDYRFYLAHYAGGGPNAHPILSRDIELLSEGIGPFKCSNWPATAFHCRYFESSIGKRKPIAGYWWDCHPWRVSQPTAAGRNYLEFYAHAVAELDACSLAYGGYTVLTMGHEDEIREFARQYRALPRVRFSDVPGMSDPVCMREQMVEGQRYCYLVNRMPFEVTARAAWSGRNVTLLDPATGEKVQTEVVTGRELPAARPRGFVSEHDLPAEPGPNGPAPGDKQTVTGTLLTVKLAAYGLRSFVVQPAQARMVYASAEIPESERRALRERLQEARALVTKPGTTGGVRTQAQETMRLCERAWRKGEYSRLRYLLDSFPLARLREAGSQGAQPS